VGNKSAGQVSIMSLFSTICVKILKVNVLSELNSLNVKIYQLQR